MPRLIDADALADELAVLIERNRKLIDEWFANLIEDAVDDAPTVDAEPIRHGHWIERTKVYPALFTDSTYIYECSECGYSDTHGAYVEVPYCWHCGTKMDESTIPSDKTYTLYAEDKPILTYKESGIVLHGERREDGLLVTDKD